MVVNGTPLLSHWGRDGPGGPKNRGQKKSGQKKGQKIKNSKFGQTQKGRGYPPHQPRERGGGGPAGLIHPTCRGRVTDLKKKPERDIHLKMLDCLTYSDIAPTSSISETVQIEKLQGIAKFLSAFRNASANLPSTTQTNDVLLRGMTQ